MPRLKFWTVIYSAHNGGYSASTLAFTGTAREAVKRAAKDLEAEVGDINWERDWIEVVPFEPPTGYALVPVEIKP